LLLEISGVGFGCDGSLSPRHMRAQLFEEHALYCLFVRQRRLRNWLRECGQRQQQTNSDSRTHQHPVTPEPMLSVIVTGVVDVPA
jgi:hypothetical protein